MQTRGTHTHTHTHIHICVHTHSCSHSHRHNFVHTDLHPGNILVRMHNPETGRALSEEEAGFSRMLAQVIIVYVGEREARYAVLAQVIKVYVGECESRYAGLPRY